MHSPISWRPGFLIISFFFILLIIAVESSSQNRSLPKKTPNPPQKQPPASTTTTKNNKSSKVIATRPHHNPTRPIGPWFNTKPTQNHNAAEFEKQEFLAAHNKVRFLHREPPFTWDPTLVNYAKKYFGQRINDCKLVHSTGPYGENLFWGTGKHWKPSDAVRFWADEVKFYNRQANTCQSGKMCGHYTQMVWRDSLRLGCFRGTCRNGDTYIICSYDPPGNYVGENPFDSHV